MTDTVPTTTTGPGPRAFDEIEELLITLLATPPTRMTACRGWTVHELVAHLAAGAAEEAALIAGAVADEPSRPTRSHAEREEPYRLLPDDVLRERLATNAAHLTTVMARLGDTPVLFTERWMTAADFAMHSRMECALHRWDIVGRDDVGWAMLGQPALTAHSIGVLTSMSSLPEAPSHRVTSRLAPAQRLVLRSSDADDVVLERVDDALSISVQPNDGSEPAAVELDAAARLLLLWGRREPGAAVHVVDDLARDVVSVLWWR
jgi:uncharacterized protein (TIGR03083 family)